MMQRFCTAASLFADTCVLVVDGNAPGGSTRPAAAAYARGPWRDVGATAYGVDWTQDLVAARRRGPVQGNLDPAVLFSTPEEVAAAVLEMAAPVAGTGYVVNLGHGIWPETPLECAQAFVETAQSVPLPSE